MVKVYNLYLKIIVLSSFLMVFWLPQVSFAQTNTTFFTDVSENSPVYPAVFELKQSGVVQGFPDNTFKPESTLTRAEAVTMILKITNKTAEPTTIKNYTDVLETDWCYKSIQKASELNIVKGYGDSTFKPNDPVKLSEALKITFSGFAFPIQQAKQNEPWYKPFISQTVSKNLIDYQDENKALEEAQKPLTRGKFAQLIWRAKHVKDTAGKAFDLTLEWKLFQNENNFYELKYPRGFEIFKGTNHSVLWKRDTENDQLWFTRTFPNSLRLSISFQTSTSCVPKKTDEVIKRYYDAVICLKNGKKLTVYGDYGRDFSPNYAKKQLQMILDTIRYVEPKPPSPPPLTPEQKLEKAREQILIEGKGLEILKMFEDKKLIETDAIGVGTGPVDYFYTQSANATIKHERGSKTILDIKEGKTSNF